MDLSHNGSLDLSRTAQYSIPQSDMAFSQAQEQAHEPFRVQQNGCLDLSYRSNGLNGVHGGSYIHYSGGTAQDLSRTPVVEHGGLLDLSKTGSYYQMPRIKLEPGLGIDPTITYKPEMDYNHNVPSNVIKNNSYLYSQPEQKVLKDERQTPYSEMSEMQDDSSNSETRVKVEEVYSSPCQIPLTVTSPDDDIDSGTESIDSKDSERSNTNTPNNKVDRKRPGRKKGQVSKVYHLWEFIRDILGSPEHCPTVIKWENEDEGIFRVVQSEVAASMWGAKKNNRTKMTYEKMSRSIRYSRKEGYFGDIPKDKGYPKKLCFKFGKKAHGWNLNKMTGNGAHVR